MTRKLDDLRLRQMSLMSTTMTKSMKRNLLNLESLRAMQLDEADGVGGGCGVDCGGTSGGDGAAVARAAGVGDVVVAAGAGCVGGFGGDDDAVAAVGDGGDRLLMQLLPRRRRWWLRLQQRLRPLGRRPLGLPRPGAGVVVAGVVVAVAGASGRQYLVGRPSSNSTAWPFEASVRFVVSHIVAMMWV